MAIKSTVQKMLKKAEPKSEDTLWPFLKEKFELGLELRRPYEQRWIVNLSFLAGKQYVFYNQSAQLLQHLVQRKGRIRVVDNQILPRFQKQVSRMIRNRPRMSVVPSSTDQEDIKAAQKGDKVLKWYWRQHQMRKKLRELSGWIYGCGTAFLDDRWDPKLGPTQFDKNGDLRYLGDAATGVWSPFEVGVPAGGLNDQALEEFPWVWKAKFRPLEYFSRYKRGKDVEAETRPMPYVDTSVLFGTQDTMSVHKLEGAVEIQLKLKPCRSYPKGLFLIGANGVILQRDDYPFESYHMQQFKDIEIPGVFWGMATTEAAIWLQKVWNRTYSDLVEYNRIMARGKWLWPRGSKVDVTPNDEHGQIFNYTPVLGHKPEMLTIKGLPATYQQVLFQTAQSLMQLYHQHEVTQGTNKSDIRSGEMVALLLEQDDYGNIPTHAVFEEGLEAHFGRVLRRMQKGYTEERIIAISGRGGTHEVMAFKGANLRNNTDVHVTKESSLPDSRIARELKIKDNYEKGIYGDPRDNRVRERVLDMLGEVPPSEEGSFFEEDRLDRQNAKLENQAMLAQPGIELIVNKYDNHRLHMEEHRVFKKQPEYQRLRFENPAAFAMLETTFILHERQHQAFLAEEQQAQLRQAAKVVELKKGGMK